MSKGFTIRCDMEGVSGVTSYVQVEPGTAEYQEARRWFMMELLALVGGLRDGGAGEIVIYDEHWFGRNICVEQLPEGVVAICGKPPYREDWPGGLDAGHTGMVLHGLHSRAGTGQVLHHSYEREIASIRLNGLEVGEIGMEAAIAGDFGVPVLLVTADSGGAGEAAALLPNVATVTTKESQSEDGATCRPLGWTIAAIRAAACEIARRPPPVQPFRIAPPVELTIDFHPGPFLDRLRERASNQMQSPFRLVLSKGSSVTGLWAQYWALKLETQKWLLQAHGC